MRFDWRAERGARAGAGPEHAASGHCRVGIADHLIKAKPPWAREHAGGLERTTRRSCGFGPGDHLYLLDYRGPGWLFFCRNCTTSASR